MSSSMRAQKGQRRHVAIAALLSCVVALPACFSSEQEGSGASPTTTSTSSATVLPSGAMAARIKFKTGTSGSFDEPASGATSATAARLFNPDGATYLATSAADSAWPGWLKGVSIGIKTDCMRFSASGESTTVCPADAGADCGAPAGFLRVSEADCDAVASGAGLSTDEAYLRIELDRSTEKLGATENVMAVLEYVASAISAGPSDPSLCFGTGGLDATRSGCADFTWQTYLRADSSTTVTQPFLLLVPPAVSSSFSSRSAMTTTRQILLPLASDSSLSFFQLSRIGSNTSAVGACDSADGAPHNTPLCAGMVFHALTLYRM